jgi:hypothetical protein
MRQFTLIQDIDTDVAHHWQLFLDDAFDRAMYLEGLHYPSYERVERVDTDAEFRRTIRVMPKLDLPGPVVKLLGNGFGYVEAGVLDKKTLVWRAQTTPNMLKGKLRSAAVVRCEASGDKCRRICELLVECTVFAIGGLVESSFEKNMRAGWAGSAAFMNKRIAAGR